MVSFQGLVCLQSGHLTLTARVGSGVRVSIEKAETLEGIGTASKALHDQTTSYISAFLSDILLSYNPGQIISYGSRVLNDFVFHPS
ncbi:hypothetical protein TREES_T100016319 [Tupaia chinensis]|uniref:Uncharacterized protein n=1 Tax=Tupaia chinensis TaxID=246437 RepID=L9JD78_TUPCH|nr:hypothetical protein TREES_T100016319 [Tupaia chinensis]